MTVATVAGATALYDLTVTHVRAALEGATLTPGGRPVTVLDSEPLSANVLPVAWVDYASVRTSSRGVNRMSPRVVVVPDSTDNELTVRAQLVAVDLLDAERFIQPFDAIRGQVDIGGVTRDAVFITTATDYPAAC